MVETMPTERTNERHYGRGLEPDMIRSELLVSSVRVRTVGIHDFVSVRARGGKAGEIITQKGDGDLLAQRLVNEGLIETIEANNTLAEMRDLIVDLATRRDCTLDTLLAMEETACLLARRAGWVK